MAKIQTSTAIELEVYQALERHCDKTGDSKISVFERALTEWLENHKED